MEAKVKYVKDHYVSNLKAEAYWKEMTETLSSSNRHFLFVLQSVKDVIKSKRFTGTKLLEVGSGPTVHNIAIPSEQFTSIVQSDLVPDNLLELRKWHKGESNIDWSPFLNIVVELEGYSDFEKRRLELESRIRRNVKAVVRGDVLSDPILSIKDLTTPETRPPYDLVLTTLALAASAVDFDSYVQVLRRIHGLLKQGGGLIICDFENGAPWCVVDQTFHHIKMSIVEVTKALGMAGFGNLEFRVCARQDDDDYEFDTLFCVAAEKL